jgi:orotate phosphoribosyltransferase/AMMECR1 domain-containing protein
MRKRKPAARGQQVRSRPTRPSASFASERQELLELLLREGIRREPTSLTVSSEDGSAAPWTLDSLGVTLSSRGAELAGRCLLHLLENFEGRQLATFGTTGVPILQSCVLLSKGKYRGLLVRPEKGVGPDKLIEGRIDPSEPVILIHDSVGLETSMEECAARLEEAGLRVEGGVCLVRFGYDSAFSRMVSRGYRMLALFDIWNDLVAHMPEEEAFAPNPTRVFPPYELSSEAAPEGLHPAELARRVIDESLRTGKLLRAPRRISGRFTGAGGVWVSVRPKDDLQRRHARGGFWSFPEEKALSLPMAIGEAAFLAAQVLKEAEGEPLAILEQSAIAVTFCSALQECEVGQLDNERYGLVVRSRERPFLLGGLMPRMPGIANEWQQLESARNGKARLLPWEPFILYRFKVQKAVEPGISWQPSGVPAEAPPRWIAASGTIAAHALEVVQALSKGREPVPARQAMQLDSSVDSLWLSVYRQGRLIGSAGGRITRFDGDLVTLVRSALGASHSEPQVSDEPLAVTVSLLHGATELGELTPEEAAAQTRHAEQALMAYQGDREGLLLPSVAVIRNLTPIEYVRAVLNTAGPMEGPYRWRRFDCITWMADAGGIRRVEHGLPVGTPPKALTQRTTQLTQALCKFLLRHLGETTRYEPFSDSAHKGLDTALLAHQAWTMARAHQKLGPAPLGEAARTLLSALTSDLAFDEAERVWIRGDGGTSISEVSLVLLALLETGDDNATAATLATTLWSSIGARGRFSCHMDPAFDDDSFQDGYPGQALLALARAAEKKVCAPDKEKLAQARRFYRHRFLHKRHWDQVCWQAQAAVAWWRVDRDAAAARFAFEICDWMLQYQSEKTGAFLNDHQPDTPGSTTALYLEALAAGIELAAGLRERARQQRYLDAYGRGVAFLDELVYQERDAPLLPNPRYALGGVRTSIVRSEIQVGSVQHALAALLGLNR